MRPHWVFDDSQIDDPLGHGERAVQFFKALRHPLSVESDRRFVLPQFWERIIRRIYGPRHPDGRRKVRTFFIMIPRGARKTTVIGGGLGLLHAIGPERVPQGQVLLGAGAEEQAEHGLDEAKSIVRATPGLRNKVKIRGSYLEHPTDGSQLEVLSAEGDVSHGSTPAAVFLDELHVYKNRKLWRALKTGMIKTPGTLFGITTTAGRGQSGLAWDEYQYARRIARGEIENESYLPIIFEPELGADWRDEKVWGYVNPGLSEGFPVLQEMREAAREAEQKPGEEDDFKQYNLNFWLDSSASPFVHMPIYDEGSAPIDLDVLKDEPCFVGVDLSSSIDLSAVVAAWRDPNVEDGEEAGFIVWPWFFCPEMNLRERQEKTGAEYVKWAAEGLITATRGNVIDYRAIEARIRELHETFDVREIAFDPHLAKMVQPQLTDDGLPCVDFRQVPSLMMNAIAALERAIIGRKFQHGGHPVLRFCFANAETEKNKQGHHVRFNKPKRWLSIDGAVASAMAVSRAAAHENVSFYDSDRFTEEMAWF